MKKLYLEDLNVGQTFTSRVYQITKEEIKDFSEKYDPQYFHLDEEQAQQHPIFLGLAGSGWLTSAICMRLWTETLPIAGGLLGLEVNLQWKEPTRPNDEIFLNIEIIDIKPSKSKPQQGIVTYRTQVMNQKQHIVQEMTTKILVWSKIHQHIF